MVWARTMPQMSWTFNANGHELQFRSTWLGVKEAVFYDGREVASGLSLGGGTYSFRVCENGQDARYEIAARTAFGAGTTTVSLKRNGRLIASETTH